MDIIPLSLRMAVRDICAQSLILRQINEIFSGSGISIRMVPPEKVTTSQRRNLVESYYASLDWSRIKDAESYLSVVGLILSLPNVPDVDKVRLRNLCASAGFATEGDAVRLVDTGGDEQVRNIVFAGTWAKPEIVIEDALSNRLKIIDPGGYLMYDRSVPIRGLLWRDLLDWWRDEQHQAASESDLHRSLYSRLHQSLSSSPPERLVFRTYFDHFRSRLGDDLPALIPQVYLHYDPYTMRQLRELGASKRLPRQRMDFLVLLPGDTRVVLEVDGQQHYATDGRADPQRYAGMVSEDRRLRLAGYEVYRFGGYELNDSQGPSVVIDFFERLFSRHGVAELSHPWLIDAHICRSPHHHTRAATVVTRVRDRERSVVTRCG